MPKTAVRLHLGEEYDKEALEHLNRTVEYGHMAAEAEIPADREKYGEMARLERNLALEALEQAKIAAGPALKELQSSSSEFDL